MTKDDGINQVMNGGGHVVILGAGANIAATIRNNEKHGNILPSMNNFIETLNLNDLVEKLDDRIKATNFEDLYSNLYADNPNSVTIKEIEKRVSEYFKKLHLPDEPTIYDYLILSLRNKDLIATFNWDPFLYQAWGRNLEFTEDLPYICFLHGNSAIGWNSETKRSAPAGMTHKKTLKYFTPTKLLYPITEKNYNSDEFISTQWDMVKYRLSKEYKAVRATIFGFGAPASDVEAVKLLNESWGNPNERNMEQFEIIDISPEVELRKKWNGFINSGHYDIVDDYFKSSLAQNPRRTSESFFCHYQPLGPSEMFRENNPVPENLNTLNQLWEWHKPLLEAEIKKKNES